MGMDTLQEHYQQAGMKRGMSLMLGLVKLVGALLMVSFAITSSAEAAIESVAPISGGTVWTTNFPPGGTFTSAEAACGSMNASSCPICGALTYVGVRPNPAYPNYRDCVVFYNPGDGTPGWNTISGTALSSSNAVCPTPTLNLTIPYVYNITSGMCERTVQETCPIADLSTDPLDPNGLKALSRQYDKTAAEVQLTTDLEGGINAYSLLSQQTQNAEQCLAGRVASELLQADSGYKVGSTVRTLAYQAHLLAVWKKFFDLKKAIKDDSTIKPMCTTLIAKVEGEMGFRLNQDPTDPDSTCTVPGRDHCIVQKPAATDPKHTKDVAFDISKATVKKFVNILLPPRTMATEANACKLTWGGTFEPIDVVHFLCCVK